MSIDTDFRATLAGHAALTTLVGTAIAQGAVPSGAALPLVVFSVRTDTDYGLDGTNLGDRADIECQCWAKQSDSAQAVAAAVRGAIATVPNNAIVTSERDSYDSELDAHSSILNVVWMA